MTVEAVTLFLALLAVLAQVTAVAVSLPTLSKPTFEARLRAFGVPEGVEIVAATGDADERSE